MTLSAVIVELSSPLPLPHCACIAALWGNHCSVLFLTMIAPTTGLFSSAFPVFTDHSLISLTPDSAVGWKRHYLATACSSPSACLDLFLCGFANLCQPVANLPCVSHPQYFPFSLLLLKYSLTRIVLLRGSLSCSFCPFYSCFLFYFFSLIIFL